MDIDFDCSNFIDTAGFFCPVDHFPYFSGIGKRSVRTGCPNGDHLVYGGDEFFEVKYQLLAHNLIRVHLQMKTVNAISYVFFNVLTYLELLLIKIKMVDNTASGYETEDYKRMAQAIYDHYGYFNDLRVRAIRENKNGIEFVANRDLAIQTSLLLVI